jgi:tetratricopeptide (TPR) repeat protein
MSAKTGIGLGRPSPAPRGVRALSTLVRGAIALTAAAAFAQPDPGQPRSGRAPTIDTQTAKTLEAAIAALQASDPAEAQAAIARLDLAKLSPYERGRVEQILFNIAYQEVRYADAQQHLKNAIDSGGLNAQEASQAHYQAAQLLMTQERWRDGAAALEAWFMTAVSPNASAYYLLAVAYYQLEDFARALPPAQRAVDLMSEPQEGWIGLLLALRLRSEAYQDAVPLLQKLVAIAPQKKTYWMQLSSVYGQLEDYENSLGTLQGAYGIGLLTEDSEIRRLADLLLFQNLPHRGAQVLESAIANRTVTLDGKLYEKLANCWLAAGELDNAIAPLTRAAELSDTGDLFVRLGEANVERRDWSAAEDALARGLNKGRLRDVGKAQLTIGIALYQQNRLAEARIWLQEVRASADHGPAASRYLALIDSGRGPL